MIKKFPIEIDILHFLVFVTIGPMGELLKEVNKKGWIKTEYQNPDAFCCLQPSEDPCLYLPNNFSYGNLAHECVHCAHHIMKNVGIKSDLYNDEIEAYLVGYIFRQVIKNKNK